MSNRQAVILALSDELLCEVPEICEATVAGSAATTTLESGIHQQLINIVSPGTIGTGRPALHVASNVAAKVFSV